MNYNNKTIAVFMGLHFSNGAYHFKKSDKHLTEWIREDKLKYNESWDWLMPVVKKLIDLDNDEKLLDSLETNELLVMSRYEAILVNTLKWSYTTIDDTYQAVIAYIIWYNENKLG